MAGRENLISQNMRTKEEQRKIARQGGIASGKKRRDNRAMREVLKSLLEMPSSGIEGVSNIEHVCLSMLDAAQAGNVKAAQFIRDTIGEQPVQKMEDVTQEPLDITIQVIPSGMHVDPDNPGAYIPFEEWERRLDAK